MNQALASVFEECASAPGALGCGVRLPDRTNRTRSFSHECDDTAIEKTLVHLYGATTILAGNDLAARQFVWGFASGQLLIAIRDDGALFCLITRKTAGAKEHFQQLVPKFLAAG
jgi:hypothetical protein